MLLLMFIISLLAIGFMIAAPLWQTQIQREREEELIFRGEQFVEAVRLFQQKNPGSFPKNFDELLEEKCIRRLYTEPMTEAGEWNVIMPYQRISRPNRDSRLRGLGSQTAVAARNPRGSSGLPGAPAGQRGQPPQKRPGMDQGIQVQKILIVPQSVLESVPNPQILGVVSPSTDPSIKIYYEQESHDKWLFFYGFNPESLPEIVYYGQEDKN